MSNEIVNDFKRPSILSLGLTRLYELIREIIFRRIIDFSRVIYVVSKWVFRGKDK